MRRCLALCACAALAAASEPVVSDLGVQCALRPTSFSYRWQDGGAQRSGDDAYARAWSAGPQLRWSLGAPGRPWALVAGLAALYVRDEQPGAVGEQALARALLAAAWSPRDRWLVWAGPAGGWGPARWRAEGGVAGSASLRGDGWEAGADAGVRWQPIEGLALGLEGGWLWSRQALDGGGRRLERDQAGPWLGLSAAWVVDPATRRIE